MVGVFGEVGVPPGRRHPLPPSWRYDEPEAGAPSASTVVVSTNSQPSALTPKPATWPAHRQEVVAVAAEVDAAVRAGRSIALTPKLEFPSRPIRTVIRSLPMVHSRSPLSAWIADAYLWTAIVREPADRQGRQGQDERQGSRQSRRTVIGRWTEACNSRAVAPYMQYRHSGDCCLQPQTILCAICDTAIAGEDVTQSSSTGGSLPPSGSA